MLITLLQHITEVSTAAKQLSPFFYFCCFWCVTEPSHWPDMFCVNW